MSHKGCLRVIGTVGSGIVAWHISKLERPRLVRPQQSHPIADPIVFWPEHVEPEGGRIPPESGLEDKTPMCAQRPDFPALPSVMSAYDDTLLEPLLHPDCVDVVRRNDLGGLQLFREFASCGVTDWFTVDVEALAT